MAARHGSDVLELNLYPQLATQGALIRLDGHTLQRDGILNLPHPQKTKATRENSAFFSCGDSHQKGKKKRKKRRKRGEKKRKKRRKREKNAPAGRVEQKNGARRAPRHLNPSINRILSVFWVP